MSVHTDAAHLTGHVVAIEAAPHFHDAITQALHANNLGNVRTVQAAVSDRPSRLTFYLPDLANLGNTTIVAPSMPAHSTFETDARPLPALLTGHELTAARIIKSTSKAPKPRPSPAWPRTCTGSTPTSSLPSRSAPACYASRARVSTTVLEPLLACGFHPNLLASDYQASNYPGALRQPTPAVPLHPPYSGLKGPGDLILSSADADHLP